MLRVIIIVALFLPALVLAEAEVKGSPDELRRFLYPQQNMVVLYGEAEETAYSDKAVVNLMIKVEEKALAAAIDKNAGLRQMVSRRLLAAGVKQEDIKTSKFSTSPQFGWFGKKPDSYEVVNRMSVSVFTEAHLKEIAAISDEFEEIQFSGTAFEHTQKEALEQKVLEAALQDVTAKKQFYEKSLGVKLRPVEFSESQHWPEPTVGAAALEEVVVTGTVIRDNKFRKMVQEPEPVAPTFDEVLYRKQVTVKYVVEGI